MLVSSSSSPQSPSSSDILTFVVAALSTVAAIWSSSQAFSKHSLYSLPICPLLLLHSVGYLRLLVCLTGGGGCGITGICVNPHIWTFDSCSRAGMDMSSWDWWGWRRVMTDSQTWKKLESQRCQNTGCGGWLGWARQTLEYQVTDKTNQCLPKHSNISDSILLNVKASSHSMLFLGFIKTFLQEVLTYSLSNLWSTVPTIIFESFASYHSAAGCILVFWKGRDNRFSTFWSNPALGGKMV